MSDTPILATVPLGFVWQTLDPFLFCVHHDDRYPAGNEKMGPAASLAGRNLGEDFEPRDGWRMYHGTTVPGFPQHPHRGFETVTLARSGYIDHSDSMGAAARFGKGDAQWMTAGRGVVHSEMFPLLEREAPNRVELFQLWLNLPAEDKMVEPHFAMLWSHLIPRLEHLDAEGKRTLVTLVAGALEGRTPPPPPPHSWAARADSHVGIWTGVMEPGARWTLPPTDARSNRVLYFFEGEALTVAGQRVSAPTGVQLDPEAAVELQNTGGTTGEWLVLQGRPIGQPVAQQGPFVMNNRAELRQAFLDYQSTRFGGWPWPGDDPVHPRAEGRFARHADGKLEKPESSAP